MRMNLLVLERRSHHQHKIQEFLSEKNHDNYNKFSSVSFSSFFLSLSLSLFHFLLFHSLLLSTKGSSLPLWCPCSDKSAKGKRTRKCTVEEIIIIYVVNPKIKNKSKREKELKKKKKSLDGYKQFIIMIIIIVI